ncbi:MAG: Holliday junction resolvase RuvX [Flavobacteriaceae bacterium]|nr:Holliday junction resolvase RuvX [Flavobacteriaceae bacterium]
MQKIIALDFGLKRTGIAITDAMQIIASGLTTVETSDLLSYLQQLFSQEQIELVVVGLPKQMDNSFSESETHIQAFLKKFAKQFPTISITRIDERFTSKMASAAMVASGMKKKKRQEKGMVDQISATIILQTYLDAK